jgi:hypothetical protein
MTVATTLSDDPTLTVTNVSASIIQTTSDDSNILPSNIGTTMNARSIGSTMNARSIPTATDDDEELLLSNIPSENLKIKFEK